MLMSLVIYPHLLMPTCTPKLTTVLVDPGIKEPGGAPRLNAGRTHASSTTSQREGNAPAFPIATRCHRRTISFPQGQNAPKEQA